MSFSDSGEKQHESLSKLKDLSDLRRWRNFVQ